jgi:hypothetical protein
MAGAATSRRPSIVNRAKGRFKREQAEHSAAIE